MATTKKQTKRQPAAKRKAKATPKKKQTMKSGPKTGASPIPTTAKQARNVGQLTRRLLVDGADTGTILAEIRRRFPESGYNNKSVSWHRWELRSRYQLEL
ncbi:MAG: hypothetical protein ACOC9E_00820 [Chloroflexota bacterium]